MKFWFFVLTMCGTEVLGINLVLNHHAILAIIITLSVVLAILTMEHVLE